MEKFIEYHFIYPEVGIIKRQFIRFMNQIQGSEYRVRTR